jgi:uncharacterized protein (TIGR03382 family)
MHLLHPIHQPSPDLCWPFGRKTRDADAWSNEMGSDHMHRILAAVVFASLCAPRISDACSPPRCRVGVITPAHGATVPANLPGIYVVPVESFGSGDADPAKIKLAVSTSSDVPLAATVTRQPDGAFLVIPDQPLVAGTSYNVTDANACGADYGTEVTFTAGPAVALPTTLGELTASDGGTSQLGVATSSGSCTTMVTAAKDSLDLTLAADAQPWLAALYFETFVDGQLWRAASSATSQTAPGESWTGRGVDLVYSICATEDDGASPGVAAGMHTVTMRGSLPGSTTTVMSTTATIDLQCGDVGEEDDDSGGCSTSSGAGAAWLVLGFVPLVARRRRR